MNATSRPIQRETLDGLFLRRAAEIGSRPAVIAIDRTLTYEELERRSCAVAHSLVANGVTPGSLVAVLMERGWLQVVALLGVLRAGAAYLPIDSQTPAERVTHLLREGEVRLVLTQSTIERAYTWLGGIVTIAVDQVEPAPAQKDAPSVVTEPDDLAYVIFTSGSSGRPKGVAITHLAALNTILDIIRRFSIGPNDRCLSVSSLAFDLSVFDIFGMLGAGGTVIIPTADVPDPVQWMQFSLRHGATIWNSVPAVLELTLESIHRGGCDLLPALRLVLLSGDWIAPTLPDRARGRFPGSKVASLGGATEAAIWSIIKLVDERCPDWRSIPYGQPLANQQIHVLDDMMEPCPIWVPGELYIGGEGLAIGYWRDPARTAASFVPHPVTGERLYRTGDRGRWLPDGDIEFLGRCDSQVKVQGNRIELSELEVCLLDYPGVAQAVARVIGDRYDTKRLVAYVIRDKDSAVRIAELREFLEHRLPRYMVPSAIAILETFPLTSNGKIDRNALPVPTDSENATYVAPRTASEQALASFWSELLGLERVGINDNFFELGGNSLLAPQILQHLRETLGIDLPLRTLFERPTIAELARVEKEELVASSLGAPGTDCTMGGKTFVVITSQLERARFAELHLGVRSDFGDSKHISLPDAPVQWQSVSLTARRNSRHFAPAPVSLDDLALLLAALRSNTRRGRWKYNYASAGGLYPVQAYLCIHQRLRALSGAEIDRGTYYYNPAEHALVLLEPEAALNGSMHSMINRPVFAEATFSLFLVAEMAAVAPMYGSESLRFALIEAGMMAQLLDQTAVLAGVGLCHIGTVGFDSYRDMFRLGPSHMLLHAYLGGRRVSEESCDYPQRYSNDIQRAWN